MAVAAGGGAVAVRVRRRDGAVTAEIAAPPPVPFAALVAGRPAEEAARLAPLVFNVCAAAQEAAARLALGLPLPADAADRVAAETLREHVLKLCVVWPRLLEVAPDPAAPGLAARAPSDPAAAAALGRALAGPDGAPEDWTELAVCMAAGRSAPARAMGAIAARWDAGWGLAAPPLFDPARAPDWPAPTQSGRAVENSPAARLADARLPAAIAAARGRGVLWRMAARLVEALRILAGARPAFGPGMAPAARGAMLARAEVGPEGVRAFARLSPTDFALAPGGVLPLALATLPADRGAPLRAVAAMAVEAADPCAPVRLEVDDA